MNRTTDTLEAVKKSIVRGLNKLPPHIQGVYLCAGLHLY